MSDLPLIRLRGVHRHYAMGETVVRALDGVDLDVRRGEFVMIVGSSGSGKSTLMHILGCLDTPTAGEFWLGGQEISRLPDDALSGIRNRRIGFIFQKFNLLPTLNVLGNIAVPLVYRGMPRPARFARAQAEAERLGLADRVLHRPTELSGGQCQRVAIARALAGDPDILFADEPTGNLDSQTGAQIMELLFDLNRLGYTIIMVTHDADLAGRGTRKIVLRDGRIVEDTAGSAAPTATRTPHALPAPPATEAPHSRIGWPDLLRVGLREGLLTHKLRTALTMLGIVIGVAGVIAMSSFSLGSKQKQADQIRALGANLVRIVDARLEGQKLTDARQAGSAGLSLRDLDLIRQTVPDIHRSAATRETRLHIVTGGPTLPARILAVAGDYAAVNNLQMAQGRMLDPADEARSARVAVLGHGLAHRFAPDSPLGRELLLGGLPFTVVGILADRQLDLQGLEASGASDANFDLLIPLQTALHRTRYIDLRSELDEIQLQLDTEDALVEAGTAIRRLLEVTHAAQDDFQLVVPLDLLKQKQQGQRLLDVLTLCVSSIALLVGGIGIMNIMLASVTERIREIGTRRAVGATQSDIQRQFLAEAVLLSFTGGVVGVLLALLAVAALSPLLQLPVAVSVPMLAIALLAAMATGIVFGLYPARQGASKNPVEALRYE